MRIGRDAKARSVAERLTAAAEEMRRKGLHRETVREVDASEIANLRAQVAEAMTLLAEEVMAHKKTLGEIRDIVADELRKRA